jgi:hypothetical protein
VAGIVATLLPLISFSMEVMGIASAHQTSMVVDSWQGKICLAGYLAAIALSFVLYSTRSLTNKNLGWAGIAVGALTLLFAVILMIRAMQATSGASDPFGFGAARVSVGFGTYLNVLTAAAVAAGGFLKAREERLI